MQWTQCIVTWMLLIGTPLSAYALQCNIGKFARYGGPSDSIDTELRGTVKWITGTDLFINPDPGYRHLLIAGNLIKPGPGEYNPTWYPGLDTGWVPILKLETYGVGSRPESNPTGAPIMVNLPGGGTRLLQVGDHVAVTGLWVIDYDHTMYASTCTDSFSYMRGLYKGLSRPRRDSPIQR
jgi:hypothetical protein